MQVPAAVDYAIRAMLELAADPQRLSRDELAQRQAMPPRYLEEILRELARHGLIVGHRGPNGGYELARDAATITLAEVYRAIDGPLAVVSQLRPDQVAYEGNSRHLGELWIGLRAAIRSVMEHVSLADLLAGRLPPQVRAMVDDADAWAPRLG